MNIDLSSRGGSAFSGKKIFRIIFVIICLESISYLGYLYPDIRPWSFLAVAAGFLAIALFNFEAAFFILLTELFIGSKGYLFYLDWGGIHLPIRIAFFLIILGIWVTNLIFKRAGGTLSVPRPTLSVGGEFFKSKWLWPYLALFTAVIWGLARGFLGGNSFSDVFFDANAYLFFALIPIFYEIFRSEKGRRDLFNFLFAAAIWVSAETLFLLGAATYFPGDTFYGIYRWVRTTGVGEITAWSGGFFRVFIQSQIYVVFALLVLIFGNTSKKVFYFCGSLFLAAIFISLSRSFEVGLAAAIIFGLIFIFLKERPAFLTSLARVFIIAAIGFLTVGLICNGFFSAAGGRAIEIGGGAAATRLAELKPLWEQIKKNPLLGSGFGTMLTFKSEDPRVLQTNPAGMYTTAAFEWGYLDILMKIGVVGLGIYLYLLWKIGCGLWLKRNENYNFGLFLGLITLLVINIFSPYLNHPLGIGYLLILTALI